MTTNFAVSGGGAKLNQAMIVAQRGPPSLPHSNGSETVIIPHPIMLNCFKGTRWEAKLSANAEISVGIEVGYSITNAVKEGKLAGGLSHNAYKTEENKKAAEGDDDILAKVEAACIGLGASAKAGVQGSAGYTYEIFYAEDIAPIPFAGDEKGKARIMLNDLFEKGDFKGLSKQNACEFINKTFGTVKVNYNKSWYQSGSHISTKDIVSHLNSIINDSSKNEKIRRDAEGYIDKLKCWADENSRPKMPTSLCISSHQAKGNAKAFAKAEIRAGKLASAGLSADLAKIEGQYKSALVRYQAVYAAPKQDFRSKKMQERHVVMTQDTHITYSQSSFTGATLTAEASVLWKGEKTEASSSWQEESWLEEKARKASSIVGQKKVKEEKSFGVTTHNRMTYLSTIVFWLNEYPRETDQCGKLVAETYPLILKGSGIVVGGSFLLDALKTYWTHSFFELDVEDLKGSYFDTLAQSLGMDLEYLIEFLNQPKLLGILGDLSDGNLKDLQINGKIEAVLIEASYAIKGRVCIKHSDKVSELAGDTDKKAIEVFRNTQQKIPQSIKLRYRIQDVGGRKESSFALGLPKVISAVKLGIALKKVEEAGSEGILDLFTYWTDPADRAVAEHDPALPYEKNVPPVVLFCQ